MNSIDTHRIVKRLKEVGFTDVQAETVTDVMREARELDLSHLVTKADLQITAAELRSQMAELKAQMAELKAEPIRYVVTVSLGTSALVVALIKLIPGGH